MFRKLLVPLDRSELAEQARLAVNGLLEARPHAARWIGAGRAVAGAGRRLSARPEYR